MMLFCEKAAEESIVLLKNEHVLPLSLKQAEQIAIIGPYATQHHAFRVQVLHASSECDPQ
jgi:beta-glucosidase-like glycosyl hydrolase